MCGRFSLTVSPQALAEQFSIDLSGQPEPAPRYNIAPTQPVAAVRERSVGGERELVLLHWGLIPSWAKDPAIGSRMINARAETAAEKPSFRTAMRRRRCLVPASGFYEWQKPAGDGARKQPFHIRRRDGMAFAIAGLWEHWIGTDGSEIFSLALLTTAANWLMSPIHGRMPVILQPGEYRLWLDRSRDKAEAVTPLLATREWAEMEAVPVSTYVNNARNEGPRCIEALAAAGTGPEGGREAG